MADFSRSVAGLFAALHSRISVFLGSRLSWRFAAGSVQKLLAFCRESEGDVLNASPKEAAGAPRPENALARHARWNVVRAGFSIDIAFDLMTNWLFCVDKRA